MLALPGGVTLEGSWVPPVRVFDVTANLLSAAVAWRAGHLGPVELTPRLFTVDASELRVKPNLRVLGPKLGPVLRDVAIRFNNLYGPVFTVPDSILWLPPCATDRAA